MPEHSRAPVVVRRLAVASSITVFALAIIQAQVGCSGEEATEAPASQRPPGAAPDVVEHGATPMNAEHHQPAREPPADPIERSPTAQPTPDDASAGSVAPARDDAKVPVYMGASKSGIVMERPAAPRQEPQRNTVNAAPQAVTAQQAGPRR